MMLRQSREPSALSSRLWAKDSEADMGPVEVGKPNDLELEPGEFRMF
jgi:hypothetical protein